MKMLLLPLFVLLLTSSIWIGATAQSIDDIDLSDVVIIDDVAPAPDSAADSEATLEREERPDPVIELELPNIAAPEIPVATQALPDEAEIVLEIPGQEVLSIGQASMASEETISVDFPDEEVRTILRNVADLFEINLVIPDTLQGRTSIKLRNVSWRQVFEVVLDPLGFTYIEDRNIIRIRSIDDLTTEPVDTRVFVVNFARANEIQGSIAPLVDAAAGGQIKVDVRTNALVITERPSRMNKIQEIIERLDKPNHQVMIESKFVEVTNSNTKNVGVNWAFLEGYEASAGPFGRQWSRERSSSDGSSGNRGINSSSTTDTTSGSVDDFPDPEVISNEESLAGSFESLLNASSTAATSRLDTAVFSAAEFNLVISALKQSNDSELVSNPTVVTMDNTEARIEIVTEVPQLEFEFNEETGTSRATGLAEPLKFGTLILVTPQVNAAGFINLKISPEVSNQIGIQETDFGDQPILSSRKATTNVMIKDGYTLALGGLTQNETTKNGTKVPILGDLPGVGRFFRSDADVKSQRNLIIFITARTLNPDGTTYRDIIDPRRLDEMGISPTNLPGYTLPQEQRELLERLEDYRAETARNRETEEARSRIQVLEEAKQSADEEGASESGR